MEEEDPSAHTNYCVPNVSATLSGGRRVVEKAWWTMLVGPLVGIEEEEVGGTVGGCNRNGASVRRSFSIEKGFVRS